MEGLPSPTRPCSGLDDDAGALRGALDGAEHHSQAADVVRRDGLRRLSRAYAAYKLTDDALMPACLGAGIVRGGSDVGQLRAESPRPG